MSRLSDLKIVMKVTIPLLLVAAAGDLVQPRIDNLAALLAQVLASSGELSRHAEQRAAEMARFITTVRAA
ncbi:hypothetical protein [Methylobacterium mesophilicum]|uniref:hypothetical protein n=1 Tax=Methylobacterium mesophilicum TaxID=39956 RepID=UPI002F35CFB7